MRVEKRVEKVLVIGGAGYIGSMLVRRLLASCYRVRVLDKFLFGDASLRDLERHRRLECRHGDFRDLDAVVSAVRGVDAVIHLGAIVGDPACAVDEQMTWQTNYAATGLIAQVCQGAGIGRMLFASTCSVYGATESLVDETSPTCPLSLYASTKLDSENLLLSSGSEGFHPTILRIGTAFGWSHRPRFDLVVNLLTAKAFCERKIVIYNGDQWRPFVHVDDVARACQFVLEAPLSRVSGETFNVGSFEMNHRLRDVAEALHQLGPKLKVVSVPSADRRTYRVSFDKIQRSLGFRCRVSLVDGMRNLHGLLQQGAVEDYTLPIYHNHRSLALHGTEPQQRALVLDLVAQRFGRRSAALSNALASA